MSDPKPNQKVSLEDMLRLKRAERPDAAFWAGFERELRQKQLTALVQKRRWWHEVSWVLNRRALVPAGAAAMVALSIVAVRSPNPLSLAPDVSLASFPSQQPAVELLPTIEVAERSRGSVAPVSAAQPAATVAAVAPDASRDTTEEVGLLTLSRERETPSSRSIAANLARLEQTEPELVDAVIGTRLGSFARVQTASLTQEPPARKYRSIARYAERSLDPIPTAPALVRERIARRLGDDLGDSINRIGVERGAVSVRF